MGGHRFVSLDRSDINQGCQTMCLRLVHGQSHLPGGGDNHVSMKKASPGNYINS